MPPGSSTNDDETQGYLSGAAARKASPALQFHQGPRVEVTRSGCCPRDIPVCALSAHVRSDRANKHQPIASPCYLPADNMTWDGLHHWFARPGEATAEDLLRGRRTVAAALVTFSSFFMPVPAPPKAPAPGLPGRAVFRTAPGAAPELRPPPRPQNRDKTAMSEASPPSSELPLLRSTQLRVAPAQIFSSA
jgi:hypothetical protein